MQAKIVRTTILSAIVALSLPVAALASGDAAAGKALFNTNCMSCHGPGGQGDGPVAAALSPKPRDLSKGEFNFDTDKDGKPGSDADIKGVIKNGAAAYGGSPLMAPWPALSDADLDNLVAFIRTLKE
jgi:mono/diheme cytochrome c family protein